MSFFYFSGGQIAFDEQSVHYNPARGSLFHRFLFIYVSKIPLAANSNYLLSVSEKSLFGASRLAEGSRGGSPLFAPIHIHTYASHRCIG